MKDWLTIIGVVAFIIAVLIAIIVKDPAAWAVYVGMLIGVFINEWSRS